MAAARVGELAGDGRKNRFDLFTQPKQDRNGNYGNEGENQGVFNESLTF